MKVMFERSDIRGGVQVKLRLSEKNYLVVSTNFGDCNGDVFRLINPTNGAVSFHRDGWMQPSEFADFLNRNGYTLYS